MNTIILSGIIGWDCTASQLGADLQAANNGPVDIKISSPGGLIGEGLEMFNQIRNYPGHTTVTLCGYAMSMASYLPLAADHIRAEDNAVYMIHNARGGIWGDHNEVNGYGQYLQGLSGLIAKAYAKRTGKNLADIQTMMDQETFFFGDQILEHGFVDEIIKPAESQDVNSESATAMARQAIEQMAAKMAQEAKMVKDDMNRAMAMARNEPPTPTKGDTTMNLSELKTKYPELVTAIAEETKTAMAAAIDQAKQQGTVVGAEQERTRIAGVRAQLIPGHEKLIETLAFDGKSSGADAAMAIVAAEKSMRQAALAALGDGTQHPAVPGSDSGSNVPLATGQPDQSLPVEEQCKADWAKKTELHTEFENYDSYLSYTKASAAGQVKILHK